MLTLGQKRYDEMWAQIDISEHSYSLNHRFCAEIIDSYYNRCNYNPIPLVTTLFMERPLQVVLCKQPMSERLRNGNSGVTAESLTGVFCKDPCSVSSICIFVEDIQNGIKKFGREYMERIMPLIIAHECQHIRQFIGGVRRIQNYHEADADSTAIADMKATVQVYAECMAYAAYTINLSVILQPDMTGDMLNEVFGELKSRYELALSTYKREKQNLVGETDVYYSIAWRVIAAVYEVYSGKESI